jgi:hypothetical protein
VGPGRADRRAALRRLRGRVAGVTAAAAHGGLTRAVASWVHVTPRLSRRWLLVAAGAAVLVGAEALPRPAGPVPAGPAAELRDRLLAAAAGPYTGYAESTGRLGLPALPQLESAVSLVTSTTRLRAFVASPQRYRVDELTPVGERGLYRRDGLEAAWDFGFDQFTALPADPPLRLPRAADLLPPALAARLLRLAPDARLEPLPARRVAGRDAPGLRLVPADPATTVGRVDVWGDAATGLPLAVEVAARSDPATPLLSTAFTEVDVRAPAEELLRPTVPPGAGFVRADADAITGALRGLDAPPAPARLAGREATPLAGGLPGVGLYGTGLAGFVLIPLGRDVADRAIDGAGAAGGVAVEAGRGRAVRVATPLLTLAVLARGRRGTLLAGTVAADDLDRALRELPDRRRP